MGVELGVECPTCLVSDYRRHQITGHTVGIRPGLPHPCGSGAFNFPQRLLHCFLPPSRNSLVPAHQQRNRDVLRRRNLPEEAQSPLRPFVPHHEFLPRCRMHPLAHPLELRQPARTSQPKSIGTLTLPHHLCAASFSQVVTYLHVLTEIPHGTIQEAAGPIESDHVLTLSQ